MCAKIDLDYVLVNEIGQFGQFQVRSVLLLLIPCFLGACWQDYIFAAASLPTRCRIPECDVEHPQYAPVWILNAIPGKSADDFDNCHRYSKNTTAILNDGTCPAHLFDRKWELECDSYVHGRTNSLVYDFHIECKEWFRALIGTLGSVGNFVVLAYIGLTSDRFGRKNIMLFSSFCMPIFGILKSFSSNYYMYAGLHFLQTALGRGGPSACYILVVELVGPSYRAMSGSACNMIYSIGQIILAILAWYIHDWRSFLKAIYIPQFVMLLPCCFFVHESVRWLINREKYIEAEKILKEAAKINGKQIDPTSLEALFNEERVESKTKFHIKEILKSSTMLKRIGIIPIWWITSNLVYYGLSINSASLSGNMYLNYIFVCGVELPGYVLAIYLLSGIGRKWSLFLLFMACSISQISFLLISKDFTLLRLGVYLTGKMAIAGVTNSLNIYTAELYPTKFRHTLFAFSSMIGRIGAILAPLTPALAIYWPGIPSLLFGVMAFISGVLTLTLPDTRDIKLPDTIKEASKIGSKENRNDSELLLKTRTQLNWCLVSKNKTPVTE